jgi:methylmalonyl-CoA epimerase
MDCQSVEHIDNEKVNVVKINPESHDHTIELLEPSDTSSLITPFLNKKGEGLHHIALEVDNIYNAIEYLEYNNIKMIYTEPQTGANSKLITFIHPQSTPGILIEICQSV